MKVFSITSANLSNVPVIENGKEKLAHKPEEQTNVDKNVSLPSFHSVGKSIAFKSFQKAKIILTSEAEEVIKKAQKGGNLQRLLNEIAATKSIIASIKNSTGVEKTDEIANAIKKIDDYNWWQKNKSSYYSSAEKAAEKAKKEEEDKHWGITNFFCSYGDDASKKVMEDRYWYYDRKYDLGYYEREKYQQIVDKYTQLSQLDEAARKSKLEAYEAALAALEKGVGFAAIRDDVNEAMTHSGGIEDRIAGYQDVKDEIQRVFVEPLIESVKNDNSVLRVPPAVMLYGATGCGKTSFLNAIREQSKEYAEIIDISSIAGGKGFKKQLEAYMVDAKKRYLDGIDKGHPKRTILLLNEAESLLAMGRDEIGKSGMLLDAGDLEKIDFYNQENQCAVVLNELKSKLDYISKLPTEDCPEGAATTIFITTNYPHIIHRDLLSRDGEFGKLLKIAVKPASDNNLKSVMQHYFQKFSNLIEALKLYSRQENAEELINGIPGIGGKGRATLIAKSKDGTIDNMHIDPTLSEFPNLEQFIKGNNPSLTRGAYSNARIENVAKRAFIEYLANPIIPYEKHFCKVKNQQGQDISPEAYRYFNQIYDMVNNPEKFKASQNTTIEEDVNNLKQAYYDGMLSDDEVKIFKLKIKDMKARFNELKQKSNLTETEKTMKEQYEEFLNSVEDLDL